MKWVVGTGRCGLHNYTAMVGGWIQSRKEWKQTVQKKYWGEKFDRLVVKNNIIMRKELPYKCITDCAQFMFIEEIREYDPEATFVWIKRRDRDKHIQSFMNRVGEETRIHPKGWKFSNDNKRELIEWYIDEVNKIIGEQIKGADYEQIWTEDMPRQPLEATEALRKYR